MKYQSRNRQRNKDRKNQPAPPRYVSIDVLIRSKPRDECTIFHDEIRHEVTTTALIYNGNSADLYVLRFIHPKEVQHARQLVVGQKVHVERGQFSYRHGRSEPEFIIRKSELRPAPALSSLAITGRQTIVKELFDLFIFAQHSKWRLQLNNC